MIYYANIILIIHDILFYKIQNIIICCCYGDGIFIN